MALSTTHIRDQFLVRDKEGKLFVMHKGKLITLEEARAAGVDVASVKPVAPPPAKPAPKPTPPPLSPPKEYVPEPVAPPAAKIDIKTEAAVPPQQKEQKGFAPLGEEKSDLAKQLEEELKKGLLAKKEEPPKRKEKPEGDTPLNEVGKQEKEKKEAPKQPEQPPSPAQTEGARFYFSPDDEEEVDRFRKNISGAVHMASFLDEVALEIIRQGKVHLGDDIQGRLQRVIASRLRSIRDLVETRTVLSRPVPDGGIGLDESQVNAIIELTENYRKRIEDGSLKKEIEAAQRKKQQEEQQQADAQKKIQEKFAQKEAVLAERSKQQTTSAETQTTPTISRPVRKQGGLSDVQAPSQLVGPMEELGEMSLEEWRNFGPDMNIRVQKIREKIDLVAEDSYEDRAKAIDAWKASPLYKLYVEIGHKSMEEEGGVEKVIAQHEGGSDKTLTVEEFDAIVDFNRSIQF